MLRSIQAESLLPVAINASSATAAIYIVAVRSLVEAAEAACDGDSSSKLHIVIMEKIILLMIYARKSVLYA